MCARVRVCVCVCVCVRTCHRATVKHNFFPERSSLQFGSLRLSHTASCSRPEAPWRYKTRVATPWASRLLRQLKLSSRQAAPLFLSLTTSKRDVQLGRYDGQPPIGAESPPPRWQA